MIPAIPSPRDAAENCKFPVKSGGRSNAGPFVLDGTSGYFERLCLPLAPWNKMRPSPCKPSLRITLSPGRAVTLGSEINFRALCHSSVEARVSPPELSTGIAILIASRMLSRKLSTVPAIPLEEIAILKVRGTSHFCMRVR
ncbi:hypothetical protein KM043_013044 [Ampulex compressa]|nr:hypothetical protein KM043_013044 [Ampulex compressa]